MTSTQQICRVSSRAKSFRITVHPDGRVVVTKPLKASEKATVAFVKKHELWIEKQLARFAKRTPQTPLPKPRKNSNAYKEAREAARRIAAERLKHFNQLYGFTYGTLSIRDQKTRWGSCSAAGNLSFNYRIAYLRPELSDYLIVHELCHIREHNHSDRFWALVAKTIPEHKKLRKELHSYALT